MDGMSHVSESLADKRHTKAELEHLRVFFLRWCEMHRRIAAAEGMEACKEAAADLTEQAHKLKEFYG